MGYNASLNESYYDLPDTGVDRLAPFYIGERVRYTGRTNYSYYEGKEPMNFASNLVGTIISKSSNNVVIEFDDYRKPYRTQSSIVYMDNVDVIPVRQYAVVTQCNLACGEQVVKPLYD